MNCGCGSFAVTDRCYHGTRAADYVATGEDTSERGRLGSLVGFEEWSPLVGREDFAGNHGRPLADRLDHGADADRAW